jgi:hypothetical protein
MVQDDNEITIFKMVLFTMTAAIVEALEKEQSLEKLEDGKMQESEEATAEVSKADAQGNGDGEQSNTGVYQGVGSIDEVKGNNALGDQAGSSEPSLSNPTLGNPISHGQVIDLWKELKARNLSPRSLDSLLRGARVYVPPPKPKPDPVG